MRMLMLLAILLGGGLASSGAYALCTLTKPVSVNYGSESSVVINSTELTRNLVIELKCTTVLELIPAGYIRVTLVDTTPAHSPRPMLTNSGNSDSIPVKFNCIAPNCPNTTEMSVGQMLPFNNNTLLTLLSNSVYKLNFSTQTVTGRSVRAGIYTTTLNLKIDWSICTVSILPLICLTFDTGSDVMSIPVSIKVENDCTTISAQDIAFGSAPLASSFQSVAGTITLVCTKGSPYSVGINDGLNAVNGVRNMKNQNNDLLSYDIYQSTTNNRWGSLAGQRWSSVSASLSNPDEMTKSYNYVAKIFPLQETKSAGNYQDTLIVDVVF